MTVNLKSMKTKFYYLFFLLVMVLMSACIGDDFVDDAVEPELRITSNIQSIKVGEQFQFDATFLNNVGQVENVQVQWTSDDDNILSINNEGLATAHSAGSAEIKVSVDFENGVYEDSATIEVGEETIQEDVIRSGIIQVTSNYVLRGNFSMQEVDDQLVLSIDDTYRASSGLPGLYIYLTNNPSTTAGAYEIGEVTVFDGAHEFIIEDQSIGINDFDYILYFCKPFNVKIGDGQFES